MPTTSILQRKIKIWFDKTLKHKCTPIDSSLRVDKCQRTCLKKQRMEQTRTNQCQPNVCLDKEPPNGEQRTETIINPLVASTTGTILNLLLHTLQSTTLTTFTPPVCYYCSQSQKASIILHRFHKPNLIRLCNRYLNFTPFELHSPCCIISRIQPLLHLATDPSI